MSPNLNALRISFRDMQARFARERVRGPVPRERAVLACLAVAALALFGAYVSVLRDAVRHGEPPRAESTSSSATDRKPTADEDPAVAPLPR